MSTTVDFNNTKNGDIAYYSCKDGYEELLPVAERTCASGKWSGSPPECTIKNNGKPQKCMRYFHSINLECS